MQELDFVEIRKTTKSMGPKDSVVTVWPDFVYDRSKDLMIRGNDFYAAWDDENGRWTQSTTRVMEIIDNMVRNEYNEYSQAYPGEIRMQLLRSDDSSKFKKMLMFFKNHEDDYHQLDSMISFMGEKHAKDEYVSKHLPYSKADGEPEAYLELMRTLYDPIEIEKIEWAIGSIFMGDAKWIQKFIVLYGDAGTGKSTVLHIIEKLFEGYFTSFDAKALGMRKSTFVLEVFKGNPLVAIQHDGDLSKIWDNTLLNQVVAHERISVEEKYKSAYDMVPQAFLFMGTNRPVEITEARSGLIRRLIVVSPTGDRVAADRYEYLMSRILTFELGQIANRCIQVYTKLGPHAYDSYRPTSMIIDTNPLYNFVSDNYDLFVANDPVQAGTVWQWYKVWRDETEEEKTVMMRDLRTEMKAYYEDYKEEWRAPDGKHWRRVLMGFKSDIFIGVEDEEFFTEEPMRIENQVMLALDSTKSIFDEVYSDCPAQYASETKTPKKRWVDVDTKLSDIDTTQLHYVRVPENHIVIDFDLRGEDGEKDPALNLISAAKWPTTYAELSQSGNGVHLHYLYDGDASKLDRLYDEGVEVKVFTGKSALRRKLTRCNDKPISTLSEGILKLKKGDKNKMIDIEGFKDEGKLRALIKKNLRKEIHPNTRPSIDFIAKLLEDAYNSGKHYDVTDMRNAVMAFANNSTNQSVYCIKKVSEMKFQSEEEPPYSDIPKDGNRIVPNSELTFFDVEVFPNLFIICYKGYGGKKVVKMINPSHEEVRALFKHNLVGFNNRRYDNHILWAAGMLRYTPYMLYQLSQRMIDKKSSGSTFRDAYNLSYADVYDFASAPNKMGLKKWEIKLGIHHLENEYPWDEPVDEDHWIEIAEYCANDVIATEAVFDHLHDDYTARLILAQLADSVPNQPTRQLLTRIIFKGDKDPKSKLVYTDLSTIFHGYKFENGVSTYMGEIVGEGGYVYAEPGMYENVGLFDIANMHGASIVALNYLGPYTKTYADIREARNAIKHGELDAARGLLDGILAPFLDDPDLDTKALSNALKTALNSLYGYTCASFDNPFRHPRNADNIVAKRGALFMINLKNEVQKRGYSVAHIKTDSIKIPNYDDDIKEFIIEYGRKYGYEFEHEATYDKMCLVNDAVYIAHDEDGWHATGKQFLVPYVFKTLFSKEELIFSDMCETKSVSNGGKMYIDLNRDPENPMYKFVGSVGEFCPMQETVEGAGILLVKREERYGSVSGTKGYLWKEAQSVSECGEEDMIDLAYYEKLVEEAKETISQYGDFDDFVKEK